VLHLSWTVAQAGVLLRQPPHDEQGRNAHQHLTNLLRAVTTDLLDHNLLASDGGSGGSGGSGGGHLTTTTFAPVLARHTTAPCASATEDVASRYVNLVYMLVVLVVQLPVPATM
jgi:hypothetical protein